MTKIVLTILIFCLTPIVLFSQDCNKIDSLLFSIEESTPVEKIDIYNLLALEYRSLDVDSAQFYAAKSYTLLVYNDYQKGEADYYFAIAMILKQRSYFDKSLQYFQTALSIYQNIQNNQGICDVYTGIGDLYEYQQNDSLALDYYNRVLTIAKQNNILSSIAQNYNNIGAIIKDDNPQKAIEYFDQAIALYSELGDDLSISTCYNNLGILYSNLGEFEKTEEYFLLSYYLKVEMNNIQGQAVSLNNLAYLSLLISENADDALKRNEYLHKSIEYAESSLKLSETTKSLYTIRNSYGTLTQAYYDLGLLVEAMDYQTLFMQVKDSLFDIEKQKNIDELETKFQLNEKRLRIEQLENEKRLKKARDFTIVSIGIALLTISVLVLIILFIRRKKDKTIYQQKEILLLKEQELAKIELERKKRKEEQLLLELQNQSKQLNSHALSMAQRNKFLLDLKNEFELVSRNLEIKDRKTLKGLANKLNLTLNNEKDWEKFRIYFEKINKDFYEKLKGINSDLSVNDKRICALIKLNMRSSEIAQVLNIAPNSIKSARYRLKKRLGLQIEDDLEKFIQNL